MARKPKPADAAAANAASGWLSAAKVWSTAAIIDSITGGSSFADPLSEPKPADPKARGAVTRSHAPDSLEVVSCDDATAATGSAADSGEAHPAAWEEPAGSVEACAEAIPDS